MNPASELWSVECCDALAWLAAQPDDRIDLLMTSPPYERARTYGIGEKMVSGQAWVDWMVEVVRAASPKVKGLIAINCEGQTRNYAYSCVPFLLMADLHRAGFNLRKPVVFHRVGIPGSGGPDWLRNDWEPVVCVTREGRLPWSDNTACGHPPKWAPGGEMSNRSADGTRANHTWSEILAAKKGNRWRTGDGKRESLGVRKTTKKMYRRNPDGQWDEDEHYSPPVLANPGNVLNIDVGGGVMGHDLAHENEAPFPLELPTFFVLSFCPPNGTVCDPFCGSGTTAHAALNHGRRFRGCDCRQSQCDLTTRRLRGVTPSMMFTEET
jgi:DNA methylase